MHIIWGLKCWKNSGNDESQTQEELPISELIQCSPIAHARYFLVLYCNGHRYQLSESSISSDSPLLASRYSKLSKGSFFTLFGMGKPQTNFQTPLSWFGPTVVGLFKFSLAINLLPDCTMYWPEDVYGQINLSSAEELQRGMLCIKSTSCGLNKPCNKLASHYFVLRSMRSTTFASSKPSTIGDKILGWSLYGSHASSQTSVDSPLPTLHLAPFKRHITTF